MLTGVSCLQSSMMGIATRGAIQLNGDLRQQMKEWRETFGGDLSRDRARTKRLNVGGD